MSGSMDYVDDNTKAPEKWLAVRTTVAKIMRSLPDLEKFQVITFSDRTHFPLGSRGRVAGLRPQKQPRPGVQDAGGDQAGRRHQHVHADAGGVRPAAQGLDTIYLCSDGLPNLGEGVKPEEVADADGSGARLPAGRGHPQQAQGRLEPRPAGPAARPHSTPSGSSTKAPTWARSCGRWPARTTAASWA